MANIPWAYLNHPQLAWGQPFVNSEEGKEGDENDARLRGLGARLCVKRLATKLLLLFLALHRVATLANLLRGMQCVAGGVRQRGEPCLHSPR